MPLYLVVRQVLTFILDFQEERLPAKADQEIRDTLAGQRLHSGPDFFQRGDDSGLVFVALCRPTRQATTTHDVLPIVAILCRCAAIRSGQYGHPRELD